MVETTTEFLFKFESFHSPFFFPGSISASSKIDKKTMRRSLLFRACTNWRPLSQSSAEVPVTPGSNNRRFSSPSFRACANPRKTIMHQIHQHSLALLKKKQKATASTMIGFLAVVRSFFSLFCSSLAPERARSSGTCSSFGSSATWRGVWVRTPPDRGHWNCWKSVKSTELPSWTSFFRRLATPQV